ncbi:MAG TPA: hypothetical protein VGM67_05040 [Gemmatimonadaceae bacterium]|jgi:hypothetical protein
MTADTHKPPAAAFEAIEAEAWAELQLGFPDDAKRALGIRVERIDDGVLVIAGKTPVLALNHAVGLGFSAPLSAPRLDEIVKAYAAAGAERFAIAWSPDGEPRDMPAQFLARGFALLSSWAKLWRSTALALPAIEVDPALRTVEIGPEHGAAYECVVGEALGVSCDLRHGIRSTLGQPNWHYYMTFDGDRPIAGGASFIRGEHAWFGLAATQDGDRRRGAQSALLARRIADARSDGCKWISAETPAETEEKPNPSYHNMVRLGFELLYERPNFVLDLAK